MKNNSFYSKKELSGLGLKSFGKNVLISNKASFYSADKIRIGSNVRIDDFCILSGDIKIGSFVHISSYCALYGAYGIVLDDFSGLSPRVTVFSATDDFGGDYLINPMCPSDTTNVTGGLVTISRYVQIGAGTTIMPNLKVGEGSVVGAMSFVNRELESWIVYGGIPAKKIKSRKKGLLNFTMDLK